MSWVGFILLSSVFLAFYDIAKKTSVRANAVLPVLLCSTLSGCAAFLLALALSGGFTDALAASSPRLVALSFVKSVIVASSWVFTFMGLRTLPVTIATPIRASAPALVFLAAFFLYREIPSYLQFAGVLLTLSGYWLFSWAGKAEGIDFLHSRAIGCAIAGACLSAVSSLWDKYLFSVNQLSVNGVQLWFQIFLVVVYAALMTVPALRRGVRFAWRWTIPMVGILLAAADWIYFTGIHQSADVPISVASLLRRFSVVITFLLGAAIFHETNLVRKGLALAVLLSGIALLVYG